MSSKALTLRLDKKLTRRLERLAESSRRSRSSLAEEAIRQYIAASEWQIAEITKAIKQADRGEYASDHDVRQIMSKWTGKARKVRSHCLSK